MVRYNPKDSTRASEVFGDRRKLARVLRENGYTVVWDDPNPAVALASRTSPARAAAAQANGRQSHGRPRSVARLCPEPLKTYLWNLDKGTLIDTVFVALHGDQGRAAEVLSTVRQAREDEEVSA